MTIAYLKMLKIIFLYVLCYVIDLQTRCNNVIINTILRRLVLQGSKLAVIIKSNICILESNIILSTHPKGWHNTSPLPPLC